MLYTYEERAVTGHEGSKRARHGQLARKRGPVHVRGAGGLLIKKGLGKPVYALLGRKCDRMELINVHFSRIA